MDAYGYLGAYTRLVTNASEFIITADSGETMLAPSASRLVTVAFDPTSRGQQAANLTIMSDDTDEPTVDVTLSGTGIDQEIDVSPISLAFGNQDIDDGATAGMTVTITNVGSATLNISSVALTGANPSEFTITADSGCLSM